MFSENFENFLKKFEKLLVLFREFSKKNLKNSLEKCRYFFKAAFENYLKKIYYPESLQNTFGIR